MMTEQYEGHLNLEISDIRSDAAKRGIFGRPLTFVFLVWGLMFVGLGIVLIYGDALPPR